MGGARCGVTATGAGGAWGRTGGQAAPSPSLPLPPPPAHSRSQPGSPGARGARGWRRTCGRRRCGGRGGCFFVGMFVMFRMFRKRKITFLKHNEQRFSKQKQIFPKQITPLHCHGVGILAIRQSWQLFWTTQTTSSWHKFLVQFTALCLNHRYF